MLFNTAHLFCCNAVKVNSGEWGDVSVKLVTCNLEHEQPETRNFLTALCRLKKLCRK
jgi:hypothetical protein